MPSSGRLETTQSSRVCPRWALRIPSAIAAKISRTAPPNTTDAVTGASSRTIESTGSPVAYDLPRLPCRRRSTNSRYWTTTGRSTPSLWFAAWIWAGVGCGVPMM
jgi:hypothetical protein